MCYAFDKSRNNVFMDDNLPHIIYDLSIADVEERREKAIKAENARNVSILLGCTLKAVFENRIPGKTITSPFYGKKFAVRIINQNHFKQKPC